MLSDDERYNRQTLINGWNQNRLRNAELAIVCDGYLGDFTTIGTTACGFGKTRIYNPRWLAEPDDFLCFESRNKSKAKGLEAILKRVNPGVAVKGYEIQFAYDDNGKFLGKPKAIAELTNNPDSKQVVLDYAKKHRIPVVDCSVSQVGGTISDYGAPREIKPELYLSKYKRSTQGPTMSCLFGGLAIRELTGIIMPRPNEQRAEDMISFDLRNPLRIAYHPLYAENQDPQELASYNLQRRGQFINRHGEIETDTKSSVHAMMTDFFRAYANPNGEPKPTKLKKHALIVGAGNLGGPSAWLASKLYKQVTIVDKDTVSGTNLNRQVFFCLRDCIEESKSETLATIVGEMVPNSEVTAINEWVAPSFENDLRDLEPDLFVVGVDQFKIEALLNYFSVKHQTPAVYGGVESDTDGRAAFVFPGKTSCLNEQARIDDAAKRRHRPHSCALDAPNPAVVTNGFITVGMMLADANALALPEVYELPRGSYRYVSKDSCRICLLPVARRCGCDFSEWQTEMSYLY